MLKKNLPFILIALIAALLIAIVIWLFDRRIKEMDKKAYRSALLRQTPSKYNFDAHNKTK